jgi:hypothetical protein
MQHRVIWIHGIGDHHEGYSKPWTAAYNEYFKLVLDDYLEVCWDSVFDVARDLESITGVELTPQEQLAEQEVREDLATVLLARSSALEQADGARGLDDGVVEWSEYQGGDGSRGSFDWLFDPNESIGDFAKYLVSRSVRTAVKEKAKERLRPLVGGDYRISIIAHSWGTVVAYDSLLDLLAEQPTLRVANLLTLGSPLWAVRRFLDDRSGRKPGQVASWVNVHARGDVVGSWLSSGFRVDKEFEVPAFGAAGAHSSYFEPHNEAVQRDIAARFVLG